MLLPLRDNDYTAVVGAIATINAGSSELKLTVIVDDDSNAEGP